MFFMACKVTTILTLVASVHALALDITNRQSILDAASTVAHGVQAIYNGNRTGGVLGKFPYLPYYWWESGGAWGGMMHYWAFTKDDSYNKVMMDALVSQLGPKYDFDMPVEAFDEGNDDQAFWVFAAMSAAEYNFTSPPAPTPAWVTVVENAWNDWYSRWNTTNCAGGLKWQFHPENAGFYYKNSISNGAFFQLSARLARYTGNQTYADWTYKIWDWTQGIGLISPTYNVFDGSDEKINCTGIDHNQWSYNLGVFLYGTAVMSNHTDQNPIWVNRTRGLLAAADTFFSPFPNATDVMFEAECETQQICNTDQWSMKAYLARWLATTSVMAPYTAGRIGSLLRTSATGASKACTGGPYGNSCGSKWYTNGYDGNTGLGQELSAMEVITALLLNDTSPPMRAPKAAVNPLSTFVVAPASAATSTSNIATQSTTVQETQSPPASTTTSSTLAVPLSMSSTTSADISTSTGTSTSRSALLSMPVSQTQTAIVSSGGGRNDVPGANRLVKLLKLL